MDSHPVLNYLIAGQIRREYIITPGGKAVLNAPGGNLLYAAAGLGVWDTSAGLISRVGTDFPDTWLDFIKNHGFDNRGIKKIEDELDLRSFIAYTDDNIIDIENPVAHFSRLGMQFPKDLLGYSPYKLNPGIRPEENPYSFRILDIPEDYPDATAIHICPLDIFSQGLLLSKFHQTNIHTVTLEISAEYMNISYWDNLPKLVKDTTAFITSEDQIRNLFIGRTTDLWEMAKGITNFGCEFVIIKRGLSGQLLFENATGKRWAIPAYPSRVTDPTGAGNAFCGGFLYGYRSTYDPLDAALHGNISASLAVEGTGCFYAMNCLPGFAKARMEVLKSNVQKI
jgi:sugar/nucleoside kinase (ribokinase family)